MNTFPTSTSRSCVTHAAGSPHLFSLGQTVATPGAMALLQSSNLDAMTFLRRHQTGQWGALDEEDKAANNDALQSGARLMSAYMVGEDRLWVITEAEDDDGHRSSTTILLPSEY